MAPQTLADCRKLFEGCGGKVKEFFGHQSKVHSVDWNCDGRYLASGSYDKTVWCYALDRDKLTKENMFTGHSESVDQLCWHPSCVDILATASGDKTVRIWDARTRKSVATVPTKGENINICWHPDGSAIAVGNKEDLVTFIDTRTYRVRQEEQFRVEVNEISWNNNGSLFFMTTGQGTVQVLSYPELKLLHTINAHPATCICIEFDPTGKYFAVGAADAVTSIWLANELIPVRTITRLEWPVRSIAFSHDGRLLASASEDLHVDIAFTNTGEKVAEVPCESATFTVAWHPKRYILAFACDDKDKYYRDRDAGSVKVYGLPS